MNGRQRFILTLELWTAAHAVLAAVGLSEAKVSREEWRDLLEVLATHGTQTALRWASPNVEGRREVEALCAAMGLGLPLPEKMLRAADAVGLGPLLRDHNAELRPGTTVGKIEALRDRASTPEERAAAERALARLARRS